MYKIIIDTDVIHFLTNDEDMRFVSDIGIYHEFCGEEIEDTHFNSVKVMDEDDNVVFESSNPDDFKHKEGATGYNYAECSKYISMQRYGMEYYYEIDDDIKNFSPDLLYLVDGEMDTPDGTIETSVMRFDMDYDYLDQEDYGCDIETEVYENVDGEWIYRSEELVENGTWEKWYDEEKNYW